MIVITRSGPVTFDSAVIGGGGTGVVAGGVVVGGGIGVVVGGTGVVLGGVVVGGGIGVVVVGTGVGVVVVFGGQLRQWFPNTPLSSSRQAANFP